MNTNNYFGVCVKKVTYLSTGEPYVQVNYAISVLEPDIPLLNIHFGMEERESINKTLQRQGWYTKLMLDDEGVLISEVSVRYFLQGFTALFYETIARIE